MPRAGPVVNLSRGGPLKLIGTLRGDGSFLAAARRIPVSYQIELYRRGGMILASGEVNGEILPRMASALKASLRLEGGETVNLTLREVAADMAAFDLDEAGAVLGHQQLAAGRTPARTASA